MPRGRLAPILGLLAYLPASSAGAALYEVFIAVHDEDELHELHRSGQIGAASLALLSALWQRGVELDRADRETLYMLPNLTLAHVDALLAYRRKVGRIRSLSELVTAGVLGEALVEAMAPFVSLGKAQHRAPTSPDSWLRAALTWSPTTAARPGAALAARAAAGRLELGCGVTWTHQEIGDVRYDPNRDALSAATTTSRTRLPRYFAQWTDDRLRAVVGTYRIGFGERLTFDTTGLPHPETFHGDQRFERPESFTPRCRLHPGERDRLPCAADERAPADFTAPPGALRGVAVALYPRRSAASDLRGHAFVSHVRHSARARALERPCRTARGSRRCAAPPVYRREEPLLARSARLLDAPLPDVYAALLAGADLTVVDETRGQLGLTAYRGRIDWLVEGIELRFRPGANAPPGASFGAIGVHGRGHLAPLELAFELSRSFAAAAPGGTAGIVRSRLSGRVGELEASLRHYAPGFANPHTRGLAAADLADGLRHRDETGARVAGALRLGALGGTGWIDLARPASRGAWQTRLAARLGLAPHRLVALGGAILRSPRSWQLSAQLDLAPGGSHGLHLATSQHRGRSADREDRTRLTLGLRLPAGALGWRGRLQLVHAQRGRTSSRSLVVRHALRWRIGAGHALRLEHELQRRQHAAPEQLLLLTLHSRF